VFRVAAEESLDFWAERLAKEGVTVSRTDGALTFADPEGLGLELAVVATDDVPLTAENPEIPTEHRIQGFDRVRAFTRDPEASRAFLEGPLEFTPSGAAGFEARGEHRGGLYLYDTTDQAGIPGAATVHHVAWASTPEEHEA